MLLRALKIILRCPFDVNCFRAQIPPSLISRRLVCGGFGGCSRLLLRGGALQEHDKNAEKLFYKYGFIKTEARERAVQKARPLRREGAPEKKSSSRA